MTGTTVTIAQRKGGVGKTTLAAHLAVAWSGERSVAVLDLDPQGSLGEWYEKREARLGTDATGLTFRTASGWGARREARMLARDHDIVVIDTPPHADYEARMAMDPAGLIVIPVQPTPVDLWATRETLALAAKEKTLALVVFNRVAARARLTEAMCAAMIEMHDHLATARLGNRVAFAACLGEGRTVLETQPSSKAAQEITALAREILRRAK